MLPDWLTSGLAFFALVFISLVGLIVAQLQMGASWRIGIEHGARPGLITSGLFRWSRNPIYVAVLVGLSGYLLIVPTWISLSAFVAMLVGVLMVVADEESYLSDDVRR